MIILILPFFHLPPETVAAAHSRGVMAKGRTGPPLVQGKGQRKDQEDERALQHALVLFAVLVVFFAPSFAEHVKEAQHGQGEGHDTGQVEHEDIVHVVS